MWRRVWKHRVGRWVLVGAGTLVVLIVITGVFGGRTTKPTRLSDSGPGTSASTAGPAPSVRSSGSISTPGTAGSSGPAAPVALSQAPADLQQAGQQPAVAVLAGIPTKGRAPMTGYARTAFGEAWTDDNNDLWGHNGLDTRNDILSRDLTGITCTTEVSAAAPHCSVSTGTLLDPYTGTTIAFTRGNSTSDAVQVDHVVALADAWQTGAQQLSAAQRTDLANDPLNLLAVNGPTNTAKGDADAASWLPPNKAYRCAYVARQTAVKAKYGLWMTSAEHTEIAAILGGCPGQPAPEEGEPIVAPTSAPVPPPAPTVQAPAATVTDVPAPVTSAPVKVAPAPVTTAPVPPPPAPLVAPVPTTAAVLPPVAAPPAADPPLSCHPLTNGGKCYKPNEFCRQSDHGVIGVDADGGPIRCVDLGAKNWQWQAG